MAFLEVTGGDDGSVGVGDGGGVVARVADDPARDDQGSRPRRYPVNQNDNINLIWYLIF